MSRARFAQVSRATLGDRRVRDLSFDAKAVWLALLSHPQGSMVPGFVTSSLNALSELLGKDVTDAVAELVGVGMLRYDERAFLFWQPNAIKHNPPENPNVVTGWARQIPNLPDSDLITDAGRVLLGFAETRASRSRTPGNWDGALAGLRDAIEPETVSEPIRNPFETVSRPEQSATETVSKPFRNPHTSPSPSPSPLPPPSKTDRGRAREHPPPSSVVDTSSLDSVKQILAAWNSHEELSRAKHCMALEAAVKEWFARGRTVEEAIAYIDAMSRSDWSKGKADGGPSRPWGLSFALSRTEATVNKFIAGAFENFDPANPRAPPKRKRHRSEELRNIARRTLEREVDDDIIEADFECGKGDAACPKDH